MRTIYNLIWIVVILVVSMLILTSTTILIHAMLTYSTVIQYNTENFTLEWCPSWNMIDFMDFIFMITIPITWLGYYFIVISFKKKMKNWYLHLYNNHMIQ